MMLGAVHEGHGQQVLYAGRDARGDSEDVVDQQRRRGDKAELDADIVFRDDIGTSAARIGEDGLNIGDRDDHEEDRDGERYMEGEGERGGSSDGEGEQNL